MFDIKLCSPIFDANIDLVWVEPAERSLDGSS